MKKIMILLILVVSISMILGGCGKDGKDGKAFLSIDWVFTPVTYWDNNTGIPDVFYQGTFYEVNPGTYNFEYTAWDYSYYSGTYTLVINKGTDGGFPFKDGKDGADIYYTLWLYSDGPELDQSKASQDAERLKGIQKGLKPSHAGFVEKSGVDGSGYILDDEITVVEMHKGNTTLRVEYQRGYPKQ
jgi:hypothetical protein